MKRMIFPLFALILAVVIAVAGFHLYQSSQGSEHLVELPKFPVPEFLSFEGELFSGNLNGADVYEIDRVWQTDSAQISIWNRSAKAITCHLYDEASGTHIGIFDLGPMQVDAFRNLSSDQSYLVGVSAEDANQFDISIKA